MNVLDHIMGVEEAGERWGLSSDHVKLLCREGKVEAKKIGKTWVLVKDQPNPKQREREKKSPHEQMKANAELAYADCLRGGGLR